MHTGISRSFTDKEEISAVILPNTVGTATETCQNADHPLEY